MKQEFEHIIGAAINPIIKKLGFQLKRYPCLDDTLSLTWAMKRITSRGVNIQTVIDVGASIGDWCEVVKPFFPDADYLLVEANPAYKVELEKFNAKNKKTDFVLAAAGNSEGTIYFDNSDPLGGRAGVAPSNEVIKIPVIKLDTHGFEIPILEGAAEILKDTNLLVIEAYNFEMGEGSVKFYELCAWLDQKGFRPIDIIDPTHRLYDHMFWQMDLVFAPKSRPEFSYPNYK